MTSPLSTLVCPYCYQRFQQRRIMFRCTSLLGPKGTRCAPARDAALSERFGMNEALPPVFAGGPPVGGWRGSARCPDCGGESTQRICPHCHTQLPVHFGKVTSRLIALIGAKNTGKTVYMTVLLHELMHSVGRRFDAAVVGSDDHTRGEFSRKYEDLLYRRNMLPGTTRPGQAELRRPLVFKVTLDRPGLFGARNRHTITSFFDTAGEDLTSKRSVDLNVRYLRGADGIILLLDPLQMRGARAAARPGVRLPGMDDGTDSPVNVLTRVTEVLYEAHGPAAGRRLGIPVAVALSKIDALRHGFAPGSPLLREPPATEPVFDEADSLAVHDHVRALLHEWDGEQIDQIMRKNYASYRYFGLSSLGDSPTADNRVDPRGIHPYRAADPFLWLLSRLDVLPSTKG
ncbi:TRAFAC clade GTPase domain-containing protein [Streptosporangium sp. DT93]|uniref:TRAFAC clade GTPase domain-containing protein n=1 Tax=Streptosporangium sp. DT93 TaxID=3393428 RepID=UPI003CF37540